MLYRLIIFLLILLCGLIGIESLQAQQVQAKSEEISTPCEIREWPPRLYGVAHSIVDLEWAKRWHHYRAQREEERILEGFDAKRVQARYQLSQAMLSHRCVSLDELVDLGRGIFVRKFSRSEGYGHGFKDRKAYLRFQRGDRGPDASACEDCHWKGGFAGGGDRVDQSYLDGDGETLDRHESRNPPVLWGLGWVELLAMEMSMSLKAQARELRQRAIDMKQSQWVALDVQGISFGKLKSDERGQLIFDELEGVDEDLEIKPFGWKGVFKDIRSFVLVSLQKHFSLEAQELVGEVDMDEDGVRLEMSRGQISALVSFLATMDVPQIEIPTTGIYHQIEPIGDVEFVPSPELTWRWQEGRQLFEEIGCSGCHQPFLKLRSGLYRVDEWTQIDLSVQGARPIPQREGDFYLVPVFSDFKRHRMGKRLKAKGKEMGVEEEYYLTRRLWGLSQSAPYLHTGEALTFDEAIAGHMSEGSEALFAGEHFFSLKESEKSSLRVFLQSLRRAAAMRVR
jgi:hypothetical protein